MNNRKFSLFYIAIIVWPLISLACGGGGGGGGESGTIQSAQNQVDYEYIPDLDVPNQSGSINLAWDPPLTNADGTPLTDLAGYRVYYGTAPRSVQSYDYSVDIGNFTGAVISNLSKGDWYFAVTAYDTSGNESTFSSEVKKSI
jgi:hypothetical protein